jgi:hypothetical protein
MVATVALGTAAALMPSLGLASGAAWVSSSVVDSSGNGVTGATIQLIALPSTDTLSTLVPGQTVPVEQVAATTTSSTGTFTFAMPSASQTQGYTDADGDVNYQLDVIADGDVTISFFSAPSAADPSEPTPVVAPVSLSPPPGGATPPIGPGVVRPAANPTPTPPVTGCYDTIFIATVANKWTTVAAAWNNVSGVDTSASYTTGSSTYIGTAVSASGALSSAGNWHAQAGSFTKSKSSAKDHLPPVDGQSLQQWQVEWQQSEFEELCTVNAKQKNQYYTQATKFAGGAQTVTVDDGKEPYAPPSNCVKEQSGSAWDTTSGSESGETFDAGVSFAGLGVSVRTEGITTAATDIHYKFTKTEQLCGVRDVPGGSPHTDEVWSTGYLSGGGCTEPGGISDTSPDVHPC